MTPELEVETEGVGFPGLSPLDDRSVQALIKVAVVRQQ